MANPNTALVEKVQYKTHSGRDSLKYLLTVAGLFSVVFGAAVVSDSLMKKDK